MKKTLVVMVLILSFLHCNTESEKNKQELSEEDTITEHLSKEKTGENEIESNFEIIDTIKDHCLGSICTKTQIKSALFKLKGNYSVSYDSIAQSEEDTLYFYYFEVYDKDNNKLYQLNTKGNKKENDVVSTILVSSNRFITKQGIKVGSTVAELKLKYIFKEAFFTYDDGLWLFFNDFNGAFQVEHNAKEFEKIDFENPNLSIESIPDHIKIRGIVIY